MTCAEFNKLANAHQISDFEVSRLMEHMESCATCAGKYPPMFEDESGLYIDEII